MISRVILFALVLQLVHAHQKLEDLDEGVPDTTSEPTATEEATKDEGPQAISTEMPEGGRMTLTERIKWLSSQPKEYFLEHHKIEMTGLLIFVVAIANWFRGKTANDSVVMSIRNTIRPIEN